MGEHLSWETDGCESAALGGRGGGREWAEAESIPRTPWGRPRLGLARSACPPPLWAPLWC